MFDMWIAHNIHKNLWSVMKILEIWHHIQPLAFYLYQESLKFGSVKSINIYKVLEFKECMLIYTSGYKINMFKMLFGLERQYKFKDPVCDAVSEYH